MMDAELSIAQIKGDGYEVIWKKSVPCPNRMLNKDDHDLNCTLCDGTGFLFDSGKVIKALMTSISLKQTFASFGRFDIGMAIITVEPEHKFSWWDSIELRKNKCGDDVTIRYSEVLQRGKNTLVDKTKYQGVSAVRLVDASGVDYTADVDFKFTTDSKISWDVLNGSHPATGVFYSLSYLCHPRYVILDLAHQFRNARSRSADTKGLIEFPVQGIGKLDFLIGDESKK